MAEKFRVATRSPQSMSLEQINLTIYGPSKFFSNKNKGSLTRQLSELLSVRIRSVDPRPLIRIFSIPLTNDSKDVGCKSLFNLWLFQNFKFLLSSVPFLRSHTNCRRIHFLRNSQFRKFILFLGDGFSSISNSHTKDKIILLFQVQTIELSSVSSQNYNNWA